jgi:succinate dehydrogenase hydrophobic anchor subunit
MLKKIENGLNKIINAQTGRIKLVIHYKNGLVDGEIIYFFQSYINSFLFLIMMTAMMIHAKLGCETIVQDYVTSASLIKTIKIIINFITLMSLLLMLFAIVKIGIL